MATTAAAPEFHVKNVHGVLSFLLGHVVVVVVVAAVTLNLMHLRWAPLDAGHLAVNVAGLLFVGLMYWVAVEQAGGWRGYVVETIGRFCPEHFLRVRVDEGGSQVVEFVHRYRRREFPVWALEIDTVASVDWACGQATDQAGRDMADWNVWLRYFHPDGPLHKPHPLIRPERLHQIGPSGLEGFAARRGAGLVAFLRRFGVEFAPDESGRAFHTAIAQPIRRGAAAPGAVSGPEQEDDA